jgi:hypothetical protein
MKFLLIICLFAVNAAGFSQNEFSEAEAKRIITTFFDGFHKGDTVLMKTVMMPNVMLQSTYVAENGNNELSRSYSKDLFQAIAERPSDQKWEERLMGFNGYVDGNLSQIWTPYEFYINGNFSHCGANSFTIIRTESGWKILNIIDSRRREGCKKS